MKNRECILFDGAGSVGFPRKKRDYSVVFRVIAVLAVVAIVIALAGSFLGSEQGGMNDANPSVGDRRPIEGTGKDTESRPKETETEETETEETKREEESGNVEESFGGAVSADLSKSELGAAFVYNYTDMLIDFEGLLSSPFAGAKYVLTEEPLVMIVHTFSSRGYSDFDKNDPLSVAERGVVAVGELLNERLNSLGVSTVHVTVVHDGLGSDPYAETRKTVNTMLEIYPTVEYVIDLGNFDAVDEEDREISTHSKNGCAQIRLTVSTYGKRWKDDVALALKMRKGLNDNGDRLCLPVAVSESRYNSGSSLYYLKVDVGTGANSSHEAFYAVEYFASVFKSVIKRSAVYK